MQARWRPSEAWLLDRDGRVLEERRLDLTIRRYEWTALDAVSPALVAAIVEGEDRRFWRHRGVDWRALPAALRDGRGASTISMQVAALIDPGWRAGGSPGAWLRKLGQIRAARALESHWSKAQILEAYLNLLGFRGELQGIGAASRVLADKTPSGLSAPEGLVLAALLPAPGASSERIVARACARAAARGLALSCGAIRAAATGMLRRHAAGATWAGAPHLAPQLARALLRSPGERLQTTLDADLQQLATRVLRAQLAGLAARNVRDGAVLVVENTSGEVLAYVGSAGPYSSASQVDGVRARRQAGSTLKPFLYELALERRHVTAASLLDDSPIVLDTVSGLYLPQNYDRDFKGLVSVRTALASSLNVPAVRTLVLVGVEPFRERLHSLGFEGITQPGDFYGYALALGSAEVSLWEQVQAYRSLARGGLGSPLRVVHAPDSAASVARRMSSEASYIVTDILADRGARALTFGLDNHLDTPFWSAVKTGTSKDMRDNWCVGFSSRFTVGVWVGNFEGDAMHEVSGVTGAAPIWQEIMTALHARLPSEAPPMPAGVTRSLARFSPAVEAPRGEYFLHDAAPAQPEVHVAAVTAGSGLARIESPANGMVIALDPDIPPAHQRVPLAARGATGAMVLRLNGEFLGPARRPRLWSPVPGSHVLALEDSSGRLIDAARFVVR
ncbi:MAG: penicillin-binding protein 1C [Gammaproteobacteria bacterium]|nr:penicillin-binding protein 1C [Gammaproteobacteria bacterium]